jgi:ABC-type dipeptide/oligopeptide/nickel transport system ATPase component
VFTIGDQVAEAFRAHRGLGRRAALDEAARMLDLVRIPSARARLREYPHQLSGGMRQRVMIAMALACDPDLLIADEPTTALDVTVQAQILELMESLQRRFRSAILLITHDLGVVAETCDPRGRDVCRRIVEKRRRGRFSAARAPLHAGARSAAETRERGGGAGRAVAAIPGIVPSRALSRGAGFIRAALRGGRCAREAPGLAALDESEGHWARCLFAREIAAAPASAGRISRNGNLWRGEQNLRSAAGGHDFFTLAI